MIGGNVTAEVRRAKMALSAQGKAIEGGTETVMEIVGWLDYQGGQKGHTAYQAPIEDTTHVFLSDYDADYASQKEDGLSLVVGGRRYEVLLIDDPMGLHEHLETFLRYAGDA